LRGNRTWPFVLAVWVGSRVFFFAVGAIGHAYVSFAAPGGSPREPPGFLDYWAHWDGGWYAAIAEHGYFDKASTSFFPLYPIALRVGRVLGLSYAASGILISNAVLLAGLIAFYRLGRAVLPERDAYRARGNRSQGKLYRLRREEKSTRVHELERCAHG